MQYPFKCNKCNTTLDIYCKADNLKDEIKKQSKCDCGGEFKRVYGYSHLVEKLGVKEINRRSIIKNEKVMDYIWQ